jgi:hypothetical protein
MPKAATAVDAKLIMRLYDLRREEKLRQARLWYFTKFKGVKTMEDFLKLAPVGSEENAFFRMVVSYWDMAAGFVTSGALNADLFFRSSNEMLFVWLRTSVVVPDLRKGRANPILFADLEEAAKMMGEWFDARAPGSYQAFRKMVLG